MTLFADFPLPTHLISQQCADGGQIKVSLQGGHLCSWKSADGIERLFVSNRTHWDGSAPIRGGVPVIFPQFGHLGPLKKHGFARDLLWSLRDASQDAAGNGIVQLRLDDSSDTAALFGPFALELSLQFTSAQLTMTLEVRNTGAQPFSFTAALHTYLRSHVTRTTLLGLHGQRYLDALDHQREKTDAQSPFIIDREIDRTYLSVAAPLTLCSDGTEILITQQGFEDVVLWNPWSEKTAATPDLAPQDYLHFACVEAALTQHPCLLAPGRCWQGHQQLRVASTSITSPGSSS